VNKVLRRIFGLKREEETEVKKMHKENLPILTQKPEGRNPVA
jgi:hypothetical protein